MISISQKLYTRVLLIIFLVCVGLFIYSLPTKSRLSTPNSLQENNPPTENSTKKETSNYKTKSSKPEFTLVAGNLNKQIQFVEGQTLYESLLESKLKGNIEMRAKEYPGIGFFIERIGSIEQGNGKYVMYSINGVEASVGVSVYVPKVNDVILFELK